MHAFYKHVTNVLCPDFCKMFSDSDSSDFSEFSDFSASDDNAFIADRVEEQQDRYACMHLNIIVCFGLGNN